jgi:hypothetical protein
VVQLLQLSAAACKPNLAASHAVVKAVAAAHGP